MTVVKFNNKPANGFSLLEDFFNEIPTMFRDDFGTRLKNSVPVNIKETKDAYLLEVVAPGFEKNDFTLNLKKKKFAVNTSIVHLNASLLWMKKLMEKKLKQNMIMVF